MCKEIEPKIPVKGSDNQEMLSLGIEPGPFEKGDLFRSIRLPPGWSFHKTSKSHISIKDKNNNERVTISINRNRCQFKFYCRYSIVKEHGLVYKEYVLDNKKNIVLFEKTHSPPDKRINIEAYNRSVSFFQEKQDCLNWLNDKYPNWNKLNAYWEDD